MGRTGGRCAASVQTHGYRHGPAAPSRVPRGLGPRHHCTQQSQRQAHPSLPHPHPHPVPSTDQKHCTARPPARTRNKKPLNAFLFFSKHRRKEIANDVNIAHIGDISKRLGSAWKAMDSVSCLPSRGRSSHVSDCLHPRRRRRSRTAGWLKSPAKSSWPSTNPYVSNPPPLRSVSDSTETNRYSSSTCCCRRPLPHPERRNGQLPSPTASSANRFRLSALSPLPSFPPAPVRDISAYAPRPLASLITMVSRVSINSTRQY